MKVIDILDKMLSGNILIKSDSETLYVGDLNNTPYSILRREILWITIDPHGVNFVIKV